MLLSIFLCTKWLRVDVSLIVHYYFSLKYNWNDNKKSFFVVNLFVRRGDGSHSNHIEWDHFRCVFRRWARREREWCIVATVVSRKYGREAKKLCVVKRKLRLTLRLSIPVWKMTQNIVLVWQCWNHILTYHAFLNKIKIYIYVWQLSRRSHFTMRMRRRKEDSIAKIPCLFIFILFNQNLCMRAPRAVDARLRVYAMHICIVYRSSSILNPIRFSNEINVSLWN